MRAAVNDVVACCALAVAVGTSSAVAQEHEPQLGAGRWVPSLAITGGAVFQQRTGSQVSGQLDDDSTTPGVVAPLRSDRTNDDRAVTPYVGGALELLTPALPIPTSPRLFVSGEFLPSFGNERDLAREGVPSRLRGPDVGSVLAGEEDDQHFTTGPPADVGPRAQGRGFSEATANGQGSRLNVQVEPWIYGAKGGVAFPFEWRGRAVRIKPSIGWIQYKIEAKGLVVDATCRPITGLPARPENTICTNTYFAAGGPVAQQGAFRESILHAQDSGVFDGVGPGVDLEMDVGRFGPIGAAVFLGIHAYYLPGDRDISIVTSRDYNDADDLEPGTGTGTDTHFVRWNVRVDPWLYRGGVGLRLQWLGSPD